MATDSAASDVPPWLAAGLATVHALLAVVMAYLGSAALALPVHRSLVAIGLLTAGTPLAEAASTALQFFGFAAGTALYLTALDRWGLVRDHLRLPDARELALALGGLVGLYAVSIALGALLSAVGLDIAQNQVISAGNRTPALFLLMVPVTFLFVAPAEELLFRGVVQGLFRRPFGPAVAVAVASALFGFAHWLALLGTDTTSKFVYVIVAALLGLVLGAAYEYSETLAVPVLIHGSYNSIRFLVGYATVTGLL